jgi:hypothetical protein
MAHLHDRYDDDDDDYDKYRKFNLSRLLLHRVTAEKNRVESFILFIRNFAYNVRYIVVPTNSSLLAIKFYSSVIKTLVYNDTKYSVAFLFF